MRFGLPLQDSRAVPLLVERMKGFVIGLPALPHLPKDF
jgi:hypothetical protein